MKKIASAHITHFRGEAHVEFMQLVRSLLDQHQEARSVVAAQMEPLINLLAQEVALVDASRKSDLTAQIEEADSRVDRTLTGIREAVASGTHHYNPAMVAAAVSLQNRLKSFGAISKKSYAEEAAAVHILLIDLYGPYATQVAALNLGGWIAELSDAEVTFETLLAQRTSEQATAPTSRLKDVRHDIDIVYHTITDRVDAAATIEVPGQEQAAIYDSFIAQLNANVAYFNEHDDHHRVRRDISPADVEPIPTQPYTGEPVIVLPTVLFEGRKLLFSVDYTLTYRHNVNVGTADLIIHGKGAYKGQRVVTFNISE